MPSRLLSLVVPPTCWVCGGPAPDAAPLCAGCRRALPWLPAGCCPRCALPAHGRGGCPAERLAFDAAVSVVAYEGAASSVVRAVKDRGGLALVPMMGAQLVAALPADLLRGARVVPVPPHPLRGRLRGFDAAGLLAAELATRTGRPLDADLLRRRGGWWRRQRGATRAERLATGRLVVEVRRPIPPPAVAALVDDVHTTGATLHACALALRAAGCERVVAVTWARAL